jgi:hypothetical protein
MFLSSINTQFSWARAVRRRVYHVRGSNALWHQDGNEKCRPWGFYVHGCVDGHSRRIVYLLCAGNKRADTVFSVFLQGVQDMGLPSRVRGDFGTENNKIEKYMIQMRGAAHKPYLRGRCVLSIQLANLCPLLTQAQTTSSLHNIRIERLWHDVCRDCLENFRRIFTYLGELFLLDMNIRLHRIALFLVFQPRIQRSLNKMMAAWNNHRLRGEGNHSPNYIFDTSRRKAIREGYWNTDPGNSIGDASDPLYGVDEQDETSVPTDELEDDIAGPEEEVEAGIRVNTDSELAHAQSLLPGFDYEREDGNWGIETYVELLQALAAKYQDEASEALSGGLRT